MRVDPQQWLEWQARLDALQRLKVAHPTRAWLCDIRIQVLNYFCARYGRDLGNLEHRSLALPLLSEELPALAEGPAAGRVVQHVKTRAEVQRLLEDLHSVRCRAGAAASLPET